nr:MULTISPECIES: hypothetical protein [unclassified Pantoea]
MADFADRSLNMGYPGGKSLYLSFTHRVVLGSLYPDPTTGCRCR